VVVRYRSGDVLTQVQLRWFMLAAGSVPVLLVAGWVASSFGASQSVAYTPFMTGILVGLPTAVAVAILRHDLLDIDRLLNGTISWVLTTVGSAAVFALVVVGIAQSGISRTGIGEGLGLAVAAFVTALVLTPLHRWFQVAVGRVLDRDRVIVLAEIRRFVDQVRDGQAEPEDVEDVLRDCLDDPGVLVLLRVPGRDGFTGLDGESAEFAEFADDGRSISLESRGAEIGVLRLGQTSVRRVRRAREAAVEARLAIDVSRLRLELRQALDDARSSRLRLVEAAATERLRLERDLHDGAQQQIVAVGMRLRSMQRRHPVGDPTHDELDLAVNALESIVDELRRLAHGVRPGMLDDGLEVALRSLAANSPVPVQVDVDQTNASEAAVTTAYFVVAEALANALKHADASCVHVRVGSIDGHLDVEVCDDGSGGAGTGFGLTALQDRVAALDGRFTIESVPGQGTQIRAML
jgi:signal transduction histidine kinase